MAEGTNIQTTTGTIIAISLSLPATYDPSGYGATSMTYTAIGHVEDVGEHGGTAQVTEFTPVDSGVVQKIKGSINYGALNLMIGQVSSDGGQDVIDAAFASKNRCSVKIAYPVRTGESTGEIHYLDVLVTKRVWQDGAANNVRKLATTFEVCRPPVRDGAT